MPTYIIWNPYVYYHRARDVILANENQIKFTLNALKNLYVIEIGIYPISFVWRRWILTGRLRKSTTT